MGRRAREGRRTSSWVSSCPWNAATMWSATPLSFIVVTLVCRASCSESGRAPAADAERRPGSRVVQGLDRLAALVDGDEPAVHPRWAAAWSGAACRGRWRRPSPSRWPPSWSARRCWSCSAARSVSSPSPRTCWRRRPSHRPPCWECWRPRSLRSSGARRRAAGDRSGCARLVGGAGRRASRGAAGCRGRLAGVGRAEPCCSPRRRWPCVLIARPAGPASGPAPPVRPPSLGVALVCRRPARAGRRRAGCWPCATSGRATRWCSPWRTGRPWSSMRDRTRRRSTSACAGSASPGCRSFCSPTSTPTTSRDCRESCAAAGSARWRWAATASRWTSWLGCAVGRGSGVPAPAVVVGERMAVGAGVVAVLWPARVIDEDSVPNNASLVLLCAATGCGCCYRRRGAAGAAGPAGPRGACPGSTCSRWPTTARRTRIPDLLAETRPRMALISVGIDNDYGHPAPATVRALRRQRGTGRTHRPRRHAGRGRAAGALRLVTAAVADGGRRLALTAMAAAPGPGAAHPRVGLVTGPRRCCATGPSRPRWPPCGWPTPEAEVHDLSAVGLEAGHG